MIKKILCILLICMTIALLAGCAKEAPEGSTSADVTDIEGAISEIDALDEDFDFSELDALEEELAEIDW
jgi:outer membrane murein-binding lipoprotein Lpp